MIMKKERIILFPGNERIRMLSIEKSQIPLNDFLPGDTYRMGKPSNCYYE